MKGGFSCEVVKEGRGKRFLPNFDIHSDGNTLTNPAAGPASHEWSVLWVVFCHLPSNSPHNSAKDPEERWIVSILGGVSGALNEGSLCPTITSSDDNWLFRPIPDPAC